MMVSPKSKEVEMQIRQELCKFALAYSEANIPRSGWIEYLTLLKKEADSQKYDLTKFSLLVRGLTQKYWGNK